MKELIVKNDPTIPSQLWIKVIERDRKHVSEGKAVMDALKEIDPAMYKIVHGNLKLDCTYRDEMLPKLVNYLNEVYIK